MTSAESSLFEALRDRYAIVRELGRASLDWQLDRLRGDRAGALEAVRRVHEVTPGSDLSELMHGFTATELNRPGEGIAALTQIDERGPQAVVWYWTSLTDARHLLRDHERELAEARRGLERAPSTSTLLNEVRALAALGRTDEVNARLEGSLSVPEHPFATPANVMEVAALELRAHGHPAAARAAAERALAWYRTQPEEERRSEAHEFGLARTLYFQGRWSEASAAFAPLAAAQPDSANYLGYVGASSARQGKTREAERVAAALAALKNSYLRGAHTYWRARIAALLGRREEATALLRQAFQEGQVYSPELHTIIDFESLRDYPPYVELLRPKG